MLIFINSTFLVFASVSFLTCTTVFDFLGGVLPFGACLVELIFIMSSIWMDQYYYVFGFLLLVYVILGVTCAEITIVLNYFQLCSEGKKLRVER